MNLKEELTSYIGKIKNNNIRFGYNADKDWVILCVCTVIIFCGLVIWNIHIFLSINSLITKVDTTGQNQSILVDQNKLNVIIEKYNLKKETFNSTRLQKPDVSDPAR